MNDEYDVHIKNLRVSMIKGMYFSLDEGNLFDQSSLYKSII